MGEIAEVLAMPNNAPLPEAPDLRIRGGRLTRKPTNDETRALLARAQSGDIESRNIIIVANQPLIRYVVRRYRVQPDVVADMWAEGSLGIIRAIELFDLSRDIKFGTYAVHWIRAFVGRVMERDKKSGVAPDKHGFIRLDAMMAENDDDVSSMVEDDKVPSPEQVFGDEEVVSLVREVVEGFWETYLRDRLTHREDYMGLAKPPVVRAVIDQRMLADEPKGLTEVGEPFGLSREAVRMVQLRIEDHLRKRLKKAYKSVNGAEYNQRPTLSAFFSRLND